MSSHFFQFINTHSTYEPSASKIQIKSRYCSCWHHDYQRWIVLTISCFGMFAYCYCYDNIVALESQLTQTYHLTDIQYNLLYSIYSFPNIFIPTFSGLLNDYFGVNILVLLSFFLIVLGQLFFIIGCGMYRYSLMLVGRFIFGIGCESYALVITPLLYEYFKNKEYALSLALLLSFARIGSSINDSLTYYLYVHTNSIIVAVSVGFLLTIICFVLLVGLICYRYRQHAKISASEIAQTIGAESQKFRLKDLKTFDRVFFLLTLNCGIMYGTVTSWMNIGSDYLEVTYGYTHTKAKMFLMLPYIIGSVATPAFGYLSDLIGKRAQLLFLSTVLLIFTHYILGWKNGVSEVIGLIVLGMSYSIFCAVIWPSFACVANDKVIGTAYGIPTSFYNLIQSVDYIIVGALTVNNVVDEREKYQNVEWFLLACSLFSCVTAIILLYFDKHTGSRLGKPALQNTELYQKDADWMQDNKFGRYNIQKYAYAM